MLYRLFLGNFAYVDLGEIQLGFKVVKLTLL